MAEMKVDSDHVSKHSIEVWGGSGFFATCVLYGMDQITRSLFLGTSLAEMGWKKFILHKVW